MLIDDLGLWDEFRINKTRDDTNVQRYYNLISNILDYQLTASRQWLSSPQARAYYLQESEYTKEIFQSLDDEWDDILSRNYDNVDELLEEIYRRGKEKGYKDIQERLNYTEQDKQALDFVRQYNFDLITKLSNDLRTNVKNTITEGVAKGENPYSLANKLVQQGITPLKGSTLTAKQRAVMIAKTEVSRAQNTAILQTYANEGYTEVTILTAEDQHVCRLCLANAYQFNKDAEMVYSEDLKDQVHRISDLDEDSLLPIHPNCRCTYLSVWDSKRDVDSEPDVVNLTPLGFNSMNDLKSRYAGDWINLNNTKENIPSYLSPSIKKSILKFEKEYANVADGNEWAIVYNKTKDKFEEIYSDKKSNAVNPLINDYGNDELYIMHNHTNKTFLSPKDFGMGFYIPENIKGVIVHIENKIFIAKFKGKPTSTAYFEEFSENYSKAIMEGGHTENTWLKFNSNEVLNKYIDYDVVVK